MKIRFLHTLDHLWIISLYKISHNGKLFKSNKINAIDTHSKTILLTEIISTKIIKPRFPNIGNWLEIEYTDNNNKNSKIYLTGGLFGPALFEIEDFIKNN